MRRSFDLSFYGAGLTFDLRLSAGARIEKERRHTGIDIRPAPDHLPPQFYGYRLGIIAAHNAPIAVRLSSDDQDVDRFFRIYADPLVVGGLEHGGKWFYPVQGLRMDVILYQLVVPILGCRHGSVLVDPIDQFFLGIESAAIDELTGGDRIEHKGWMAMRI